MTTKSVSVERRPDGVATVWIDCPGQKVNTLGPGLVEEVEGVLRNVLRDDRICGIVVASAKEDSFIAGADLKILETMDKPEQAATLSATGNALLLEISRAKKPVVAAVHGAALGGGLEVALACHYILASDHPKTVFALPEVQLGLLPAGGGTQRLVSRVGLTRALPLLLTGKKLRSRKACKLGLIDAVTTPGGIVDTAARAVFELTQSRLRRRTRKRSLVDRLASYPPLRNIVLKKAAEQAHRKTRGNYPAPAAILDAVETGMKHGLKAGLRRESELFGELVVSPESRSLVRLFHAMNESKSRALTAAPRPVNRVGVVGAGLMGSGVASVSIAHAEVVLRDLSEKVLSRGVQEINTGLSKQIRAGAISKVESHRRIAGLQPTTEIEAFDGCDLVVEAVFEELDLKRRVFAEIEEHVDPKTVIASNTSALPIRQLASGARHPERIIGMHYFSPVPKMPLLEIITTEATSDECLATAVAFGRLQGKTCIVVTDGPGFYTTRILAPYLDEAVRLVAEGADSRAVNSRLKDFGFPVGPITLIDEVGIDVAAHVAENLGAAFAARGVEPTTFMQQLADAGILGRKSGQGFFLYRSKKRPRPTNPKVNEVLGTDPKADPPPVDAVDRLALIMANEAVRCLEEKVIASPSDGDLGAILGLGFPPFLGGPFRWIDALGAREIIDRLQRLEDRYGARFSPAATLEEMAKTQTTFYG